MTSEAEEPSSEQTRHRRRARWLRPAMTAFGGLMTAVATVAAAISAWTALQSIEEAKSAQLLNRRIDACYEIDRRATAGISAVLSAIRETATRDADDLLSGEAWGSYVYYDIDIEQDFQCEPDETAEACGARRQEAQRLSRELFAVSRRVSLIRSELEFEASQTFNLIGPPELARAERDLLSRLGALAHEEWEELPERVRRVDAAVEAHGAFQAECRRSVGDYREE